MFRVWEKMSRWWASTTLFESQIAGFLLVEDGGKSLCISSEVHLEKFKLYLTAILFYRQVLKSLVHTMPWFSRASSTYKKHIYISCIRKTVYKCILYVFQNIFLLLLQGNTFVCSWFLLTRYFSKITLLYLYCFSTNRICGRSGWDPFLFSSSSSAFLYYRGGDTQIRHGEQQEVYFLAV